MIIKKIMNVIVTLSKSYLIMLMYLHVILFFLIVFPHEPVVCKNFIAETGDSDPSRLHREFKYHKCAGAMHGDTYAMYYTAAGGHFCQACFMAYYSRKMKNKWYKNVLYYRI